MCNKEGYAGGYWELHAGGWFHTGDQVGAVEGGSVGCTCSSAGERGCHTWNLVLWGGGYIQWRCNEEGSDKMSKR